MPKVKRKVVAKPKTPTKASAKKETESEGGFLSPWYKSPFQIESVTYESAGQCILAQKAQAFGDEEALQRILAAKSADERKTLGDSVKGFDEYQWRMQAPIFVKLANSKKFFEDTESKDLLNRLTDLGERELVFADPSDSFFGIRFEAAEAKQVSREQWGENIFGKTLDVIRRMGQQTNDTDVESPFDKFGGRMNVYW